MSDDGWGHFLPLHATRSAPYRSTRGCVYVHDALDVGPRGVDGAVEVEAGQVDPEVGASPVHYLTLKVDLHLEGGNINVTLATDRRTLSREK